MSGAPHPTRVAVCLMGPTATGKTELSIAMARRVPLEVISVDSALVYRGMDIGTAKPASEVRNRIPHHLIDVAEPHEAYSAGRFRNDALAALEGITARGRLPVLVGGTGLYFRALLRGLSELPAANAEVRSRLDAEAAELGWPALHRRLQQVDPEAARRIRPRDGQRIQRALEVYEVSGRSLSELQRRARTRPLPGWRFLTVALIPRDRLVLADRIERRFYRMMEQGLLAEVSRVYRRAGVNAASPAMRAVGYRQLRRALDGEIDLSTAVDQAVAATRQLAKRQLTWLRGERPDLVLDPLTENLEAAMDALLESQVVRGDPAVPVIESRQESLREQALGTGRLENQKRG